MQLVQFFLPDAGRRVGLVRDQVVIELGGNENHLTTVVDVASSALRLGESLVNFVNRLAHSAGGEVLMLEALLSATPGGSRAWILPPVDQLEPSRVHITGTGLTHLGSVKSRDEMHGGTLATAEPQTDSARMFAMGVAGGKPRSPERGTSPEWFYKGNGKNLRGHRANLTIPAFALGGGEEPEIAACYLIDGAGVPRRLGFVLGNEWSDHATEKINYLYLAPSKLRECAIGPVLNVDHPFDDVRLRCTVTRSGTTIYDSGELCSGESAMCHSLQNIEDHHFKYPLHRRPGDLHIHFLGTSKLSYGSRHWEYSPGDEIRIEAPGFSPSLVNGIEVGPPEEGRPIRVIPA